MVSIKSNIKFCELYSTHCSYHESLSFVTLPSHFLSGTLLHFHKELLALHRSWEQPLSALEKVTSNTTLPKLNPPSSCSGSHSSFTPTTCTHSVTTIYELSSCFQLITLTILSAPLSFQYSMDISCKQLENIAVTHFTPAHLP